MSPPSPPFVCSFSPLRQWRGMGPTSMKDLPTEVLQQMLSWIHPRHVLPLRRLSRRFQALVVTRHFATINLNRFVAVSELGTDALVSPTSDEESNVPSPETSIVCLRDPVSKTPTWFDEAFFHWPLPYQIVYADRYLKHLHTLDWDASDAYLDAPLPAVAMARLSGLARLNLNDCGLIGGIPVDVTSVSLINLTCLSLYDNDLEGPIPSELSNLSNLTELYLGRNRLTGNIPPSLGQLTQLVMLNLGPNQLEGTIPGELGNLVNLKELFLGKNRLTGSIPVELFKLTSILDLFLHGNMLSGSIPKEVGQLISARCVYFEENMLKGEIPREVLALKRLEDFDCRSNAGLTCSFECPMLQY